MCVHTYTMYTIIHTHTHIHIYTYTCECMCRYAHTYACMLKPREKEKRKRGRGRNLPTSSSTERKLVFISNLAIVQNNDSVMCEYCKHIAKVSQP